MIVVPMQTTPLSAAQAAQGLVSAYESVFGVKPERNRAKMLLSLVWIETARGNSLQNRNWGNISAGKSYQGKVWEPPWVHITDESSERNKHLHAEMLANRAPLAFRAYDSHEQGAADFVRQLRHSFPEVLAAADTGDADTFREALSKKYSHDYRNKDSTSQFRALATGFEPLIEHLPTGNEVLKGHGMLVFAGLMFATLGVAAWWALRDKPKPQKELKEKGEETPQEEAA